MRMRFLKYLAGYTIPVVVWVSISQDGLWSFTAFAYAFVLISILELFLPDDPSNLEATEEELAKKDRIYDWMLYLNVPIQFGLLWFFLDTVSTGTFTWWELVGKVHAMGLSCGVTGINVAHELGHRVKPYERVMAKLLLMSSLYMHFIIEHNRGHHKRVSTAEDPASARKGEGLYSFYGRTLIMSIGSAWQLEKKRLLHKGGKIWSLQNEMLRFFLFQCLFLVAIGWFFGLFALGAYMLSAAIGMLLLETINYVEHYGLRRRKLDNGRYERVMPWHSWNSNQYLGRIILYELTRHSDHHYLASREYQILRHMDEAPQLPAGYPAMMLLALLPPAWFRVMDPRVEAVMAAHPVEPENEEL